MLVFIDESGDPGMKLGAGSSAYFVVTAVIFESHADADACDKRIVALRREMRFSAHKEFHFNGDRQDVRRQFLQETAAFPYQYTSLVLNKAGLTSPGFSVKESLYKYTTRLAVMNAKEFLQNAIVVVDKCGDKEFRSQLARYLGKHTNDRADGVLRVKRTKMEKSHTNNLLQLADMVCGAVAYCYSGDEGKERWQYRRLIRSRELRVQVWPSLKMPESGA